MEGFSKDTKIVIGMVGLPARGKTFISRKISRYLNWLGYNSAVFNIENYRRIMVGTIMPLEFFDPNNSEAVNARKLCAEKALSDMIEFLDKGDAAIYDGTNTTKDRRLFVKNEVETKVKGAKLIWIETIVDDFSILEENIKDAKINNPDYVGIEDHLAINNYKEKIDKFNNYYETLTENEYKNISFLKLINGGKQVSINNITGYLQTKIMSYVMNLQLSKKTVYFTRHGESIFNTEDRVGGDPDLSANGTKYSKVLGSFFKKELGNQDLSNVQILTSTLKRALITANEIKISKNIEPISLKLLDEINSGICDSMTYSEIKEKLPQDYLERAQDKLRYRYPRGESYVDLVHRIEPVLFEIEKAKHPIIVVAHQAVIRCLYAYFTKHEIIDIPFIDIPLHTVIKLSPSTYFCEERRFKINIENGEYVESEIQKPILLPISKDFKIF